MIFKLNLQSIGKCGKEVIFVGFCFVNTSQVFFKLVSSRFTRVRSPLAEVIPETHKKISLDSGTGNRIISLM